MALTVKRTVACYGNSVVPTYNDAVTDGQSYKISGLYITKDHTRVVVWPYNEVWPSKKGHDHFRCVVTLKGKTSQNVTKRTSLKIESVDRVCFDSGYDDSCITFNYDIPPAIVNVLGSYCLGLIIDKGAPDGPFQYPVIVKQILLGYRQPAAYLFPNENVGNEGLWKITPFKEVADVRPFNKDIFKKMSQETLEEYAKRILAAIKIMERPEMSIPAM